MEIYIKSQKLCLLVIFTAILSFNANWWFWQSNFNLLTLFPTKLLLRIILIIFPYIFPCNSYYGNFHSKSASFYISALFSICIFHFCVFYFELYSRTLQIFKKSPKSINEMIKFEKHLWKKWGLSTEFNIAYEKHFSKY